MISKLLPLVTQKLNSNYSKIALLMDLSTIIDLYDYRDFNAKFKLRGIVGNGQSMGVPIK